MFPNSKSNLLDPVRRRAADASLAWRYVWSPPTVLLVLGMHRSGTSLVSRILNLMGVELGAVRGDAEAGPGEETHWESPAVNWVNDQVFERSGHTWDRPPDRPIFQSHDVWRCRRILWEFGGSRIASIKDPRILMTYPMWQHALPKHAIVACLRHPMNVARSLEKRDGLTLRQGLDLWRMYNERLLERVSAARSVYWFDFEAGRNSAHRLIQQIAADYSLDPSPAAFAHFDPAARHHRESAPLPGTIGDLYDALRLRMAPHGVEEAPY